jgi:hypothetical protein
MSDGKWLSGYRILSQAVLANREGLPTGIEALLHCSGVGIASVLPCFDGRVHLLKLFEKSSRIRSSNVRLVLFKTRVLGGLINREAFVAVENYFRESSAHRRIGDDLNLAYVGVGTRKRP